MAIYIYIYVTTHMQLAIVNFVLAYMHAPYPFI